MLLWATVALGTVVTWCYACEYERIFGCASGLQKELASTRFVVTVRQLNTYCDSMEKTHRCILEETQSCQIDVRAAYAQAVKAEQLVIRDLCRPGLFQDEYLKEAHCISAIYSEKTDGPCRKPYSKLLAAAFDGSSISQFVRIKKNSSKSIATSASDPAALLYNLCCAYYAVYECTQVHAGRCGGRSFSKNLLRQIYQGLDHNCRPFKTLCNQLPSSNSRLPGQDTKQHSVKNGHHTIMHTSLAETIRSVVLGIIVSLTSMLWALGGLVTTT
ncbi:uncharacterized protein LOC111261908 isoform X1 [Varroa jacobsoni]|uniref:uncharacterized protein LOC111261908 isoform X1 n=2 Tax=Varroa jacobsoni TaxID=62625 RepID=UPI000BF6D250|nr:uncharacterized protein LOC111261908 isoform X1 [Varroa jacobsoni]